VIRAYYAEGEYLPGLSPQSDYYGEDRIGSVRRVFSSGLAPSYDYGAYGDALQATTPVTDFNYAGTLYNADSGLYLTKHRAYDPASGRFLSRDPVGEYGDPVGNLYAYAGGNPISLTDPSGLFCWPNFGKNPGLAILVGLTIVAGGGPEDPFADVAAALEIEAAEAGAAEGAETTTSVFWSGSDAARGAAENWAAANGGTTLEMSAGGQATEAATQGADWLTEARPAWVNASSNFANSASGEVQVFQGPLISTQSVWATTEYPALMANPNVTGVIYHGVGW
jgi:RHS repeat-associated protein